MLYPRSPSPNGLDREMGKMTRLFSSAASSDRRGDPWRGRFAHQRSRHGLVLEFRSWLDGTNQMRIRGSTTLWTTHGPPRSRSCQCEKDALAFMQTSGLSARESLSIHPFRPRGQLMSPRTRINWRLASHPVTHGPHSRDSAPRHQAGCPVSSCSASGCGSAGTCSSEGGPSSFGAERTCSGRSCLR